MATLTTHSANLGRRGRTLALIQVVQVGSGLIGQVLLLARWSPDEQTDLFLLLSSLPWLVSAALLVTGLEMAFPASYHRTLVAGGEQAAQALLVQVQRLSLWASFAAAGISGGIVAIGALRSGLSAGPSLWMGAAMGAQVIPAALGGLWRGTLVAQDKLVYARLALLAGSLLTVVGYALLPGPSALALPLVAVCATLITAAMATPAARRGVSRYAPTKTSSRSEITPLLSALVGLSAAAGLVHLQTIIERAAVERLGTGAVTALAAAGRGWDAVLAVIVAAAVLPVYPHWASYHAQGQTSPMRALLRWSLRRALILSGWAAAVIGSAAWLTGPWLAHHLGWETGEQAARMALAVLPRFVLVSSAQPLILKHYASGTPWYPVSGAALGVIVLIIGVLLLTPRYHLTGFAAATTASAIPGWLVLVRYELRSAS